MRGFYCFVLCLFVSLGAFAKPIKVSYAFEEAKRFLIQKGIPFRVSDLRVVSLSNDTRQSSEGIAPYYLINNGENRGFVIVAGDDRLPSILGYSDVGTCNTNSLPPEMTALLQSYDNQISKIATGDKVAVDSTLRESVPPLIQSYWAQTSPYNSALPSVTVDGKEQGLYVGCVALAAAEVMDYYKYPDSTFAEIPAWTSPNQIGGKGINLPSVPAGTRLDWDNMLNLYTGTESEAQISAVANLMRLVTTGTKTQFGAYGSGAYTSDIPFMLRRYFGYSNNTRVISHRDHKLSEWNNIIYNELALGRPVIIGAQSTDGGHAFVSDGYEDGLFHINWGWAGMCNGWFRIDILDPGNNYDQDEAITGKGFSMSQEAVIGIAPASNEEPEVAIKLDGTIDSFEKNNKTVKCLFYNMTGESNSFDYGIGYITNRGKTIVINSKSSDQIDWAYGAYYTGSVNGLAPGEYKIHPVSRLHGQKLWGIDSSYVVAVIDAQHNATFTQPTSVLSATNFVLTGTKSSGVTQQVCVNVQNSGEEYYGNLYLWAVAGGLWAYQYSDLAGASIPNGESRNVVLNFTPEYGSKYHLYITTDKEGSKIIGSTDVVIADSLSAPHTLVVSSSLLNNSTSSLDSNVKDVQSNWISGKFIVKNNGQLPFTDNITVYLLGSPTLEGIYHGSGSCTVPLQIKGNDTVSVKFNFYGEKNFYYVVALRYSDTSEIGHTETAFLLGGTVDRIDNLVSLSKSESSVVYSLDGRRKGFITPEGKLPDSLPKGIYVCGKHKIVKL